MVGDNYLSTLVGLLIDSAYFDGTSIFLATNEGIYKLQPEGDCCARCFVASVENAEALINGGEVVEVQELTYKSSVPTLRDNDDNHIDTFGIRLHLANGHIVTIDMRVEHNGYYSGSLELYSEPKLPEGVTPLVDF